MRCGGGEKRWRSAICSSETRHRCLEQTAAEFLIFAAPPRFCNIIGAAIPCASRAMTALKSCATLQGCYPAIWELGRHILRRVGRPPPLRGKRPAAGDRLARTGQDIIRQRSAAKDDRPCRHLSALTGDDAEDCKGAGRSNDPLVPLDLRRSSGSQPQYLSADCQIGRAHV